MSACNCTRGGADMGSLVDMYTCTDACTHSKQGVGIEVGWLRHNHSATQGHQGFHTTIQRGWSRHGKSGGHVHMYWCMYTF